MIYIPSPDSCQFTPLLSNAFCQLTNNRTPVKSLFFAILESLRTASKLTPSHCDGCKNKNNCEGCQIYWIYIKITMWYLVGFKMMPQSSLLCLSICNKVKQMCFITSTVFYSDMWFVLSPTDFNNKSRVLNKSTANWVWQIKQWIFSRP